MKNKSKTNKLRTSLWIILSFTLAVSVGNSFINDNSSTGSNQSNRLITLDSLVKEVILPAKLGSMSPRLSNNDNQLAISWLEPYQGVPATLKGTSSKLMWSTLDEKNWSEPMTVVNSSHMFSNFADIPSVLSDQKGNFYAHWLEKSTPKMYGYDVKLASFNGKQQLRKDFGAIWKESGSDRNGYDGFVSMVPDDKGMQVFWIDGRVYKKKEGGPMRLMTAKITDKVTGEAVLDGDICSCCNTSAVNTSEGPIIFYRGRTQHEIRDILSVRRENNGWTKPKAVSNDNWNIAGCAVNGPKAAAINNRVAVAWFTGVSGKGGVRVSFSTDAGKTYSQGKDIDLISPNGATGRVDIALLDENQALVSWLGESPETGGGILYLRKVNFDGSVGPYVTIAQVNKHKRIGFPQMERINNELFFVWTVPKMDKPGKGQHEKVEGLKMVKVDINDIPSFQ